MSLDEIQQGIDAVQRGDLQRGDQHLRRGLESSDLAPNVRAAALMWLAETNPADINFRIQCYRAAAQSDPTDQDIQDRLNALIKTQPPPSPPPPPDTTPPGGGGNSPTPPSVSTHPNVPRLWEFGVRGGPTGIGTAFLVVRDGLVATTRYVVGNMTDVTLVTRDGREFPSRVVRSYPDYDLAFIRTNVKVPFLRDMTPSKSVRPRTVLIADDYTERKLKGECHQTSQYTPAGWFPTNFPDSISHTFTGAPVLDDKEDLVGMLTRNNDRHTGNLYGLHISVIRQRIEAFYTEMQTDSNRLYCGNCGCLSRAGAEQLYYCEICGGTFPFAADWQRSPHPEADKYY